MKLLKKKVKPRLNKICVDGSYSNMYVDGSYWKWGMEEGVKQNSQKHTDKGVGDKKDKMQGQKWWRQKKQGQKGQMKWEIIVPL